MKQIHFTRFIWAIALPGLAAISYWLTQYPTAPDLRAPAQTPAHPPVAVARANFDDFPIPTRTASDEELLQLARSLMLHLPTTVLAWAQSQTDATLRQRLISAVVQAWGEMDPRAAVNWVLSQLSPDAGDRDRLMAAALAGAARQPAVALQLIQDLIACDADSGQVYGNVLIRTFCAQGNYQSALALLAAAPADSQADWAKMLFSHWTATSPAAALQAAPNLPDPPMQRAAFNTAVADWSARAPGDLAAYAITLPPVSEHTQALQKALDNWSLQDPAALGNWLNTLPPGPDFDAGVALMLAKTDGANRTPETALQWIATITDPQLKQNSLLQLLQTWQQTDPTIARQYLAQADWLDNSQRQQLLNTLTTPP